VEDFLNARPSSITKVSRAARGARLHGSVHVPESLYTAARSGTGWLDPKYVAMLDEANRTLDPKKRYELLAKAEKYHARAQPVIPLDTRQSTG
jgi:ABC-type transport system substrate-binding protein